MKCSGGAPPSVLPRAVTHSVSMSSSQLTLSANMTPAHQWTLRLPSSESVHPVMTFDPNDRNYLYVMTSHHVSTAPVSLAAAATLPPPALIYSCRRAKSGRLATVRRRSASSGSFSPQFSSTYFCADLNGIRRCIFPNAICSATVSLIAGRGRLFLLCAANADDRWLFRRVHHQTWQRRGNIQTSGR